MRLIVLFNGIDMISAWSASAQPSPTREKISLERDLCGRHRRVRQHGHEVADLLQVRLAAPREERVEVQMLKRTRCGRRQRGLHQVRHQPLPTHVCQLSGPLASLCLCLMLH